VSDDCEEDTSGGLAEDEDEDDEPLSSGELSDLQKEGEMPLEELLAVYGHPLQPSLDAGSTSPHGCSFSLQHEAPQQCSTHRSLSSSGHVTQRDETYSSSEDEILSSQDLTLDKDEIARDLLLRHDSHDHETSVNDLITIIDLKSPAGVAGQSSSVDQRLVLDMSQPAASSLFTSVNLFPEDDSDDSEYVPETDNNWKKAVSIGAEFQTSIPDVVSHKKSVPAYSVDERLLWNPSMLPASEVETYCQKIHQLTHTTMDSRVSGESSASQCLPVKDDEQALYLLLQCNYNVEEALRRRQMEIVPPADTLSLWSSDERCNFVNGLRLYGKDFYMIQQNKVRSRSVSELVQFYYLWKKTEEYSTMISRDTRDTRERTSKKTATSSASLHGDDFQPSVCYDSTSCGRSVTSCDTKRCRDDTSSCATRDTSCSRDCSTSHDTTVSSSSVWSHDGTTHCRVLSEPSYHEPLGSHGIVSPAAHFRFSSLYNGTMRSECQIVGSPYDDSFAESAMSFGNDAVSCNLAYCQHPLDVYSSCVVSASQDSGFVDTAYAPAAGAFYSLPALSCAHEDDGYTSRLASLPYHTHHNDFEASEPCAKRFRPSGFSESDMIGGHYILDRLVGSVSDTMGVNLLAKSPYHAGQHAIGLNEKLASDVVCPPHDGKLGGCDGVIRVASHDGRSHMASSDELSVSARMSDSSAGQAGGTGYSAFGVTLQNVATTTKMLAQ